MSFSSWFQQNEGLVNSVAGLVPAAEPPPPSPPPLAVTGQEPARVDPGSGGGSGLGTAMKIAGLVGAIYTGGATAIAGAALGVAKGGR